MQTVIHIDANHQQVRLVRIPSGEGENLAALQGLVGGHIEMACRMEAGHVLFVDEEGLFKPQRWGFRLLGMEQPFVGNGVIVGPERYDSEGEYIDTASVPAHWLLLVQRHVQFLSRTQIDAWAKANASEPEITFTDLDTGETEVIAYRGKVWGDMPKPEDDDDDEHPDESAPQWRGYTK